MKPQKDRHFGDTENPMWLDELVAALGAEPVHIATRCSAVVPVAVSVAMT